MKKNKQGSGILGGLLLLLVGIGLLWWNEGRTVKAQSGINEAKKNYTQIKNDKIDSKYDGKLIATNGEIDLSESEDLKDEKFGISVKSTKLQRYIEMYQWEEKCETDDDDNKKCTYEKVWNDAIIDSTKFEESGHTNPGTMPYDAEMHLNDKAKLGKFRIPVDLIDKLSTNKTKTEEELNKEYNKSVENLNISGKYLTNAEKIEEPEIGNIRISFKYSDTKKISILAVQIDDTFKQYTSKKGKVIYKIKEGTYTGEEILMQMTKENKFFKWLWRIIGTLLVIASIGSLFDPIQKLANFIPIVRNIVSIGISLVSFVVGLAISLLVIAIAWFRYRPLLSISLIIVIIGLLVFLKTKKPIEIKSKPKTKSKKKE
ncbi:MAG: TMEM43 family protein [Bacilli bacterium]|nr:TMEM43 family protein [Bacilli bacterium]